jgi:hypothetical protein
MIAEVYDAFRSAGADDDKARAAAIALSEGDRRFDDLREQIGALGQDLRAEIGAVEQRLGEQIQRVERGLQQPINGLDRPLTVLEWNVRLNSVILIGLLLKLIVFG